MMATDKAKSDSEASRAISVSSQVEEEEAASSLQRASGEMCFNEASDMVSEEKAGEIGGDEAEASDESGATAIVAVVMDRGFCMFCVPKLIALDSIASDESLMTSVFDSVGCASFFQALRCRTLVFLSRVVLG